MSNEEMRKEIRQYLESAEVRLLKAVHAMLKEYSEQKPAYELSAVELICSKKDVQSIKREKVKPIHRKKSVK